ncbi:MAG: PKD domain-containing protein [Candidatus Gracilibacteria bacterium]
MENNPSQINEPLVNPSAPVSVPAVTPTPVPLTPEEKTAKRKLMLKRLGIVSGVSYITILVLIFVWGFLLAGKELVLFDYLPVSQDVFSGFLFTLFNIMIGALTFATMMLALFGLAKSLLAKKEDIEKKKKGSRLALFAGIGFFAVTIFWLFGLWMLGPRLVREVLPPIVTIPENTIGLTSPVEITFDASNIPVDEKIYQVLAYTWDFGDGSTANGVTVSHTYTKKAEGDGIYTVTLNVTYMDLKSGQEFDYEQDVDVSIQNETTAASFVASPESGDIPLKVDFDATGSYDPDGEITAYEWDFDGDGRYDDGEGEEATYTFEQEGNYSVTLRVTDNNGQSTTTTMTIEAGSVGGMRAVISTNAGTDGIYYTGTEYEFDGEMSQIEQGKITKYSWNFGDGSKTLESRSVSHTFEEAGTYTVDLTVQNQDGVYDKATLEIDVVDEGTSPVAKITTTPALENGVVSGAVPLTVIFNGSSSTDKESDIVEYSWDFNGDGIVDSTGNTVTYTYQEIGDYTARLVLVDSAANEGEATVPVSVTKQGVLARLEVNTANGEVPLVVKFDASGSTYKEGNIVSYEYDFGDGTDSYVGGSSVTYKYTGVGTFNASVTVLGDDGSKDSTSIQIVVRPVALTACFTVNTNSGTAPLFVSVDPSCSQGTIDTYEWNFGNGELSFDRKPGTHTYSLPGTYIIKLEVTSPEGIVSSIENTITVK